MHRLRKDGVLMTIRRKTAAETVEDLRVIIHNRRERIKGLEELLKSGKEKDTQWIRKEIGEHQKWITDTERVIKRFYAPATK